MLKKEEFLPCESLAVWNVPEEINQFESMKDREEAFRQVYREHYFDDAWLSKQNLNYVVVGMNPGDKFSAGKGTLLNFHGSKVSADYRMASIFYGTVLWGAFMTDLSSAVESDSSQVSLEPSDIDNLLNRLKKIEVPDDASILALGKKTFEEFEDYVDSKVIKAGKICQIGDHKIHYIQHYSRANGHWSKNVEQLREELLQMNKS